MIFLGKIRRLRLFVRRVILLLLIQQVLYSFAQATPNVHYTVSPERGTIDTEFLVQVSITEDNTLSVFSDESVPTFEETKELSLKYVSNSVQQQIINGDVSVQKSYIYRVVFNEALPSGEHNLPRGYITINNLKHRLPTRKIIIEKHSASNNQLLPGQGMAQGDGFQFIQTVSNERPYVGEQIFYKVEIIAPDNLEKAELEEFEPQGIWRERYGKDEKKIRRIQNIRINSFSESWFPVHSGEVMIPERTLLAEIREFQRRRAQNFGQSLGEQLLGSLMPYLNQFRIVEKKIKTSGFKINVKPLPPAPEFVKGYIPVGQLKVTSSLDSSSTKVGEPVTLTIQVSGDANLRPLDINLPKNFDNKSLKRYDSKPIINKTIGESSVTFYKTFKILLTPLRPGDIEIPEFSVYWFNPVREEYQSYKTKNHSINVTGNSIINEEEYHNPNKIEKDESELNIKNNQELLRENFSYLSRNTFYFSKLISIVLYLFFALLLLLGFMITFYRNSVLLKNKEKKANIKKIKESLSLENSNSDLNNISLLIKELLDVEFKNIKTSNTTEEIKLSLSDKISSPLVKNCVALLEAIDLYKYAADQKSKEAIFLLTKEIHEIL